MVHQKKSEQEQQSVGKSRGGLSTKIHAAADALGNPVRFIITSGQASEYGQANALIEGFNADHVLADKGYDSDNFIEVIENSGAIPVIPSKSNRVHIREHDRHIYKERNLVERLFQKLKEYRRIATRYERKGKHYLSMLYLAAVMIWVN